MTPERWQQVKLHLAHALELAPSARAPYLDGACAGDRSIRDEVDRLLIAEQRADAGFLAEPAVISYETESPLSDATWIGRRVGAYDIVEEIGAGGMGAVYRAVRADQQYRSEVAVKLLRTGHGARAVVSRFRTERQILAGLDHPNIARLLDGGTTDGGVPYFVMELIDGQRIDEYCAARDLSIRRRLQLFGDVCSAVQYAHQRLIIHRDIKPTNLLVTAAGVPKLLDFGIAKMLNDAGGGAPRDATVTAFEFLTPGYASPEQIKGEPITTASDVYSLGVVLYELLTGRSPYDISTRAPHEMAKAICECEPARPSTAVRRTESLIEGGGQKLVKRLSGDLDNITLKALHKDPSHRYGSVEQFAEDIRRHLANLPVIARQDTVAYRASKFAVRHWRGVTAAAAIAAALVAGMAGTLYQARIARQQAALAKQGYDDVRRLANSLIFEIHDSIRQLPGATAGRQLIVQRAQEFLAGLAPASTSDPALLRELASAYERLADVLGNPLDANVGNTAKALESYRKSVELRDRAVALDPSNRDIRREAAASYVDLALALRRAEQLREGDDYLRRAVRAYESLASSDPDDRRTQYGLVKAYDRTAGTLVDANAFDRGREMYEKCLAMYQRLADGEPGTDRYRTDISFAHKHIAAILAVQKRFTEALEHERAALVADEAEVAAHPNDARAQYTITFTYSDTGYVLNRLGDVDGALRYYRKALAIRSSLAAADARDTRALRGSANTYAYIANLLEEKKDFRAALESNTKALQIRQSLFQHDPGDDSLRFDVTRGQAALGSTYVTMAFQPHVATERQQVLCGQATPLLSKALPVAAQRGEQGRLVGDEQSMPDRIRSALARCNGVLSERGARASSPR